MGTKNIILICIIIVIGCLIVYQQYNNYTAKMGAKECEEKYNEMSFNISLVGCWKGNYNGIDYCECQIRQCVKLANLNADYCYINELIFKKKEDLEIIEQEPIIQEDTIYLNESLS